MQTDWKYVATLLAAIAGVAVPVGLWQWDLRAKSLSVSLQSSVELQTPASTSMPDLRLTIAGEAIVAPVLSTLELINDGAKPISSADFESPLELRVSEPARVLRARVSSADPPDLKPEIEVAPQLIRLKPMLLNPSDRVTLTVLTTGPLPVVSPRARIAGVSSVRFKSLQENSGGRVGLVISTIAALGGFVLYFVYGASLPPCSRSRLSPFLSLSTMLALSVLSSLALKRVLDLAGIPRELSMLWPALVLLVLASGLVFYLSLRWFRRAANQRTD